MESETLAKTTSLAQEPPKPQDPEGRTLKEVFSRVGGGSRRRRAVVNGGGGEEGLGMEDSEIKGASTLLKMQRSGGDSDEGLSRLGSVLDAIDNNDARVEEREGSGGSVNANEGHPDGEMVEVSDEDEDEDDVRVGWVEFSTGDFVWSKIKSHPWWPGRIYGPSQASDYANKLRQRHKILVAYFGDGTFAWCNSSQLKPFEEDFVQMSKQSGSKNFVNAVDRSLDEVSRLVDLKMTCSCFPKENLIGFGRTLAENAGIKEGHLVPEGGIEKFSTGLFEPNHCLSVLKGIAQLPDVDNMLKLVVLRSWLSAFYRKKGGRQLPTYHDPQPIPGLKDYSSNRAVGSKYSKGKMEVGNEEPAEEDWDASPSGQQKTNGLLQRCQEVPEDRLYQRRKQKSIAEIFGGNEDAERVNNKDAVVEKETKTGKKTSAVERNKRKSKDEGVDLKGEEDVGNVAKEKATPIILTLASRKKPRSVSNESTGEGKSNVRGEPKAGTIGGTPTTSSGGRKRKSIDKSKGDLENNLMAGRRSIKKSKFSNSSETADCTIASLMNDGSGPKERSKPLSTGGRKKAGGSGERGSGNEGRKGEMTSVNVSAQKQDGGADKRTSKGHLSRERKKSRYLSPPFTSIRKGKRKEKLEAEPVVVSSKDQLRERMTRASGNLIWSPLSKSSGKGHNPKAIAAPGAVHKTSLLGPQMPEQYQSIVFNPMKVEAPINEVLSQVKSRACNPQNKKGSDFSGMVVDFLDTFRSSIFSNGSESNLGMKNQTCVQRESEKSDSVPDDESQQSETRKSRDPKSDKSKGKEVTIAPDDKDSSDQDPAVLLVSFGPGSCLPTKDDIIKKYAKYGSLNMEETNMFYQNHCAKVVFSKSSAAKAAFNNSQLVSPFDNAHTTFRLRYLANGTKTRELRDISGAKSGANTPAKPSSSQFAPVVSQLNCVKGKLERMAAMLETPDGKISPGLKSKLKGELKGVLEKVSLMIGSSS